MQASFPSSPPAHTKLDRLSWKNWPSRVLRRRCSQSLESRTGTSTFFKIYWKFPNHKYVTRHYSFWTHLMSYKSVAKNKILPGGPNASLPHPVTQHLLNDNFQKPFLEKSLQTYLIIHTFGQHSWLGNLMDKLGWCEVLKLNWLVVLTSRQRCRSEDLPDWKRDSLWRV